MPAHGCEGAPGAGVGGMGPGLEVSAPYGADGFEKPLLEARDRLTFVVDPGIVWVG